MNSHSQIFLGFAHYSSSNENREGHIYWGSECHSVVSNSLVPYSPRNCPGQNTGVGSLSLLQGIFPTQGSNPGVPHCSQILYQLNHRGSPYHTIRLSQFSKCAVGTGTDNRSTDIKVSQTRSTYIFGK